MRTVAKNNNEAYTMLAARQTTRNPGQSITGQWEHGHNSHMITGMMPPNLRDDMRNCLEAAGYLFVAYSYQTPIAWWSKSTGWQMPSQKYSVTTTSHQSGLICELPTDEVGLPDWGGEYLYPKFISGGVTA